MKSLPTRQATLRLHQTPPASSAICVYIMIISCLTIPTTFTLKKKAFPQ